MAARAVDLYIVYSIIKRLVTPFDKWDAYKRKIIDADGKVLRKRETLTDKDDLNSWGHIDILVANLKKLLGKVPGGSSFLGATAAAILLLREGHMDYTDETFEAALTPIIEEVAANSAGAGAIAGIGVGPSGEPGVKRKKKKAVVLSTLRRKAPA